MTPVPSPDARPGTPLTVREREVLALYGRTGSWKIVAHRLGISQHTAENHAANARSRLGVDRTVQAVWIVFVEAA